MKCYSAKHISLHCSCFCSINPCCSYKSAKDVWIDVINETRFDGPSFSDPLLYSNAEVL